MIFFSKKSNRPLLPNFRTLRKMDYISDQQGIMNRYINEKIPWTNHLQNTQQFITEYLQQHNVKHIAILGSGWLLDIPVTFLIENGYTVDFYDIRHPHPIVHQYRKNKNFNFIEMDITGGLIDYAGNLHRRKKPGTAEIIEFLKSGIQPLPINAQALISVNLLSQLDSLVTDYLFNNHLINHETIQTIRWQIQYNHVQLIKNAKGCLITDSAEISMDSNKVELSRTPLLYSDFPFQLHSEKWIWKFDTLRTYNPNNFTYRQVYAFNFLRNE